MKKQTALNMIYLLWLSLMTVFFIADYHSKASVLEANKRMAEILRAMAEEMGYLPKSPDAPHLILPQVPHEKHVDNDNNATSPATSESTTGDGK